jgi:hypothetical protein
LPAPAASALPPGTPAWVTPELVAATLDCWQPRFPKALTTEDAIQIITNAGRLLDALGLSADTAATSSTAHSE